jgi:hypothetical protein
MNTNTYTAFNQQTLVSHGSLEDVILKIKKRLGKSANSDVFIFSDQTGKTIDFNFNGSDADITRRLKVYSDSSMAPSTESGPGRPKLGVVSREVSLLPRHWEWLATQQGGASSTLRRLVEESIKKNSSHQSVRQTQEKVYKIMLALAGDLPGYEEALRALYKKDKPQFSLQIKKWPDDIKDYVLRMADDVFTG